MARFAGPAAEESVACNLIPMIDIMFLLLLFFMLGADMVQREMVEVALPRADECVKDDVEPGSGARTTVNISHRPPAGGLCASRTAGAGCLDDSHWIVTVGGREIDLASLEARLRIDAVREIEPGPPPPPPKPGEKATAPFSGRPVMIRADAGAPFGHVRAVMEACSKVGIYKVKVGATQPEKT